jgi:hypothetical protein
MVDSHRSHLAWPLPSVFGRAFLSPNGSSSSSTDSSDSKAPNPRMAGSVMIFRLPTLEAVWERVKDDAYWTAGVWDRENATVDELLGDPTDEHAQFKA